MPEESDRLQSLIANIIEAENKGDPVDREAFISQQPEQADSIREFFANHDSMKAGSSSEDMTLPPSDPNPAEDASVYKSVAQKNAVVSRQLICPQQYSNNW